MPQANEDTQDTDIDLEDIEVNLEDIESDETEESEDEANETESKDTEPEELESKDETESKEESKEEEESEADKQKAFNRDMAERRIQEKAQREAKIREDQQAYIEEAIEDPIQEVVRQTQVDMYNLKVENNTSKLTNSYEKALKDFDILSSDDPVVKAEVDAAIDFFQAKHVVLDTYGNPKDVSGDLYDFLKTKADSISKLTGIKVKNQEVSKGKEKSKTFTPPSRAPKEVKKDDDFDAFDEEAKKW